MKSVCVAFLVICVLQAVHTNDTIATRPEPTPNYRLPQHRDSFIEIIQNIAKQTIQLAKDAIKVIQSRIEQLFQEIYEKIFGIQQIAEDTLNAILDDIEKLAGNNQNDVNPCVQAHVDEVKQIISNGRVEIGKCIRGTMGEADKIRETLFPYVESIATLIANITGVIEKCSSVSNTVSAAICITQHVTDVSNAVSGIIHDSHEAVKLASVEILAVYHNTHVCVKTTLDTVKADVEKVVIAIKECMGNNTE